MTNQRRCERLPLPVVSAGSERALTVYRYGQGRPKAYLHAALHAEEWPGLLVLQQLIKQLEQAAATDNIQGEVVLVPFANPVGLAQHLNFYWAGRYDFAGSGNFNRNFPDVTDAVFERVAEQLGTDAAANIELIRSALRASVAELAAGKETAVLKKTLLGLAIDADYILDLHCDSEALLHLYASQHQQDLALELGAELGAEAILLEDVPGGGAFDNTLVKVWTQLRERSGARAAIPLACFATTVELRGRDDVNDAYAAQDASAIYRFLQRRGVLRGDPGPLPTLSCQSTPLAGVDVLRAPAAGLVIYRKNLRDPVAVGETVAEIVNLDDPAAERLALRSRAEGILFARVNERLTRPGHGVGKIAGCVPLPHRKAGQLLED